jgi:hypothetical protein
VEYKVNWLSSSILWYALAHEGVPEELTNPIQLIVYRLQRHSVTQELELKPIDQWVHGYALWSLAVVEPSLVIVGDAAQSVATLRWTGSDLEFLAKDFPAINSMNVTADSDFVLQSDVSCLLGFFAGMLTDL